MWIYEEYILSALMIHFLGKVLESGEVMGNTGSVLIACVCLTSLPFLLNQSGVIRNQQTVGRGGREQDLACILTSRATESWVTERWVHNCPEGGSMAGSRCFLIIIDYYKIF